MTFPRRCDGSRSCSQPAPPSAGHIIVGAEAVEPYGRVYDPLVTLGWIAAWTERIGLGTSIVLVPLHNPIHLAEEVATLQELLRRSLHARASGWAGCV